MKTETKTIELSEPEAWNIVFLIESEIRRQKRAIREARCIKNARKSDREVRRKTRRLETLEGICDKVETLYPSTFGMRISLSGEEVEP